MFIRREYFVSLRANDVSKSEVVISPSSVSVVSRVTDLPSANVVVAFGRQFGGGEEAERTSNDLTTINRWAQDLELIEVNCRVSEFDLSTGNETEAVRTIFLGYISAPSLQLMRQNGGFSFQMQHWATTLMHGSMLANFAIETAENQQKVKTLRTDYQTTSNNRGYTSTLNRRLAFPLNFKELVAEDLWANGFKRVLAAFAAAKFNDNIAAAMNNCKEQFNAASQPMKAALKRLQGPLDATLKDYSKVYDSSGAPIQIRKDLHPGYRDYISLQMVDAISRVELNSFESVSFWNAILNYCSEYGLLAIFRATDALVCPINVGRDLKDIAVSDIAESEEVEISWTAFQQSAIRGVGVATHLAGQTHSKFVTTEPDYYGCFVGSSDPARGQVLYMSPPRWLAKPPVHPSYAKTAQDKGAADKSVVSKSGAVFSVDEELNKLRAYIGSSYSGLLNGWAKSQYMTTNLANRVLSVTCPVRFDIGIGSMVRVGIDPERLVSRTNLPLQSVAGLVVATTLTIDRQRSIATMLYQLDYVRTEQQLQDPAYYYDKHPLFEDTPRIIEY